MNENKTRGTKNLVYSMLGQMITIAIGLVLPRLFIVNYGSETNGLVNSVNQFVAYLGLFEAGIGTVSLQALYGPVAKNDRNAINSILSATNIHYKKAGYGYLSALIVLSLVYPFVANSELPYYIVASVVFLSGISNVILFLCQGKYRLLLQAEGKNYIITNLLTIITVATGALKAILITTGYEVIHVLMMAVAVNLIQVVYIYWYIKKHYCWVDLGVNPNHEAISEKNYMLIHQISGMIFYNTDVLILTALCDLKIVSVYSMYKLIITQLENILSTLSSSVNFILGQRFNTDLEGYKAEIDIFESCFSAIAFTLFTVAQAIFVPFMGLYTSGVHDINYQDYRLAVMFAVIAILTAMRTPMMYTINFAGHFKKTTPQTILEAVINFTVSIVGTINFGVFGALCGTIIALLYRTNDVIIYANRKILNRSPKKTYLVYAANFMAYIALSVLFVVLMKEIHSYIMLLVYCVVYTGISLVVFIGVQSIVFPARMKTALKFLFGKRNNV